MINHNFIKFGIISISLVACTGQTKNKDHQKQAEIESLKVKLEATENQLLDVRNELENCRGDSLFSKRKKAE